jgi:hypothetical protein
MRSDALWSTRLRMLLAGCIRGYASLRRASRRLARGMVCAGVGTVEDVGTIRVVGVFRLNYEFLEECSPSGPVVMVK